MQKIRTIFLLVILFFVSIYANAQQDDKNIEDNSNLPVMNELENLIETLSEEADEAFDYSELIDELEYYSTHKMNLNNPDYSLLKNLFGLNDYQVYQLQRYLSVYGQMLSIYELHLIEGMDTTSIQRLMKYVEAYPIEQQEKFSLRNVFKYGKHRILMRYGQVLEKQQGYSAASDELLAKNPNSRYLGSPQAYLLKYNFNYNNKIRFGFTAEKDAGEEFFKGHNKWGFDFYSFHIFLNNKRIFKRVALGDYKLSFGQGLAMNMGFSVHKPDNSVSISKNPLGLGHYSSSNESDFLRGIATTIDCKIVELTLFYSYKKLDASLSDTIGGEVFAESFTQTGYHRTPR